MLGGTGIGSFQGLVQRFLLQPVGDGVVHHAKGGVHPRRFEIGAQKIGAEGVQRADAGTIQLHHLLPAARIAPGGPLAKPPGELGAHVRGRRAGKGHHQHAVHVRTFVGHQPQHPLHQHGGLAGARRRRQQYAVTAILYRR